MHKNLKILTFLLFLTFTFSTVFANGAQEENFSDIDEKIDVDAGHAAGSCHCDDRLR